MLATTVLAEDNITNTTEIIDQPVICSINQCDSSCVVCSDNKCHDSSFTCTESLGVSSISPEEIDIGKSQLNIQIVNNGNVDLNNVYAEVSGEGITMIDNLNIERLVVGDKDYSFVNINAEKSGNIDLAIKLYSDGRLIKKDVEQIKVIGQAVADKTETYNQTELMNKLNAAKEKYKQLDEDYQNKKSEDYILGRIEDVLKDANNYLKSAQFYMLDGDYKRGSVNLQLVEDSLSTIELELRDVKKKQVNLIDRIKSNLLYISSFTAGIISILTAYKLTTNYVNKKNLSDMHHKIKTTGTTTLSKGKELLLKKKEEEILEDNKKVKNDKDKKKK